MSAEIVYLFDRIGLRPKYHRYGDTTKNGDGWRDTTVCGLTMYDTQNRTSASLRLDHAACFARPCRKCFR